MAPSGDYLVPTWDFGNIPVGQTVTRLLSFDIRDALGNPVGLPNTDPRWESIYESELDKVDLLLNRTTSLKISDWLDTLAVDTGLPYPVSPDTSSDVSVFFVPEPSTVILLLAGALCLVGYLGWRKKG